MRPPESRLVRRLHVNIIVLFVVVFVAILRRCGRRSRLFDDFGDDASERVGEQGKGSRMIDDVDVPIGIIVIVVINGIVTTTDVVVAEVVAVVINRIKSVAVAAAAGLTSRILIDLIRMKAQGMAVLIIDSGIHVVAVVVVVVDVVMNDTTGVHRFIIIVVIVAVDAAEVIATIVITSDIVSVVAVAVVAVVVTGTAAGVPAEYGSRPADGLPTDGTSLSKDRRRAAPPRVGSQGAPGRRAHGRGRMRAPHGGRWGGQ